VASVTVSFPIRQTYEITKMNDDPDNNNLSRRAAIFESSNPSFESLEMLDETISTKEACFVFESLDILDEIQSMKEASHFRRRYLNNRCFPSKIK
jgi:hypothetical protein